MLDKSKLGNRYTCYECGTKFYDLNRDAALCPECNTDQAEAPVRDIRALLSRNSGRNREVEPAPKDAAETKEDGDDAQSTEETTEATDGEAEDSSEEEFDELDLGLEDVDEDLDEDGEENSLLEGMSTLPEATEDE